MFRTMTGTLLGIAAMSLMLVGAASSASASIITYDLTVDNCTGGCNPGAPGTSMGTVKLDDNNVAGNVTVTVTLVSPLQFVNTGLQNTIDFNLGSILSGVSADNFSALHFALDSGTAGTEHFDGFGNFQYSIIMDTAQGAGGAQNVSPLSFHVLAPGILASSFVANSQGAVFGVDVYNSVTGRTGPIGTTGSIPTTTPEPISSALVGTGLASLFFLRRRAAK